MKKFVACFLIIFLIVANSGFVQADTETPIEQKNVTGEIACQLLEQFDASFGLGLEYSVDGINWLTHPIQAINASGTTVIDWSGMPTDEGLQLRFHLYVLNQGTWTALLPQDHPFSVSWDWLNEFELSVNIVIPYCRQDVTATKIWDGGKTPRETIWLQLNRSARGVPAHQVGDLIKLEDGVTQATWPNQPRWAGIFNPYVYWVQEVNSSGQDFTPSGYEKLENGLVVTNTYIIPQGDITATKTWVNGPKDKPETYFQLYLGEEAILSPMKLDPATNQVVWKDLALTNKDGQALTYRVVEVDASGVDSSPANYTKVENGLNVTNTFVPPRGSISATKTWKHGPEKKPEVYFQLMLGTQAVGTPQKVDPVTNQVTWPDLALSDQMGVDLKYFVKEVDSEGADFTPRNYQKTEQGLSVTNTFVPPVRDITAAKVWIGGDAKNRPAISLQLLRDGLPIGDPVKLEGQFSYTWKALPQTDLNGTAYTYTVDEVSVPAGFEKTVRGLVVTNRHTGSANPLDPTTPTDPTKPLDPTNPSKPTDPVAPTTPATGGSAPPKTLPETGLGISLIPMIGFLLGSARYLLKKE